MIWLTLYRASTSPQISRLCLRLLMSSDCYITTTGSNIQLPIRQGTEMLLAPLWWIHALCLHINVRTIYTYMNTCQKWFSLFLSHTQSIESCCLPTFNCRRRISNMLSFPLLYNFWYTDRIKSIILCNDINFKHKVCDKHRLGGCVCVCVYRFV